MADDKAQSDASERPEAAEPPQGGQQAQPSQGNAAAQPAQRTAAGRRPLFRN
jgi:hypothetical protein